MARRITRGPRRLGREDGWSSGRGRTRSHRNRKVVTSESNNVSELLHRLCDSSGGRVAFLLDVLSKVRRGGVIRHVVKARKLRHGGRRVDVEANNRLELRL